MQAQITVLPDTDQPLVFWNVFRTNLGAPAGFSGSIRAANKLDAANAAKLLYGEAVTVEAERPRCNYCGEYLPCSQTTWGCKFPQGDGSYPWP